jgi:hypothetical protein
MSKSQIRWEPGYPDQKGVLLRMSGALPLRDFEVWKSSKELARLAKRYIWWKTVDQAMENPEQIVAQVMNMGDWNDVCRLVDYVGDEGLCRVIKQAEIGMFNERSWHYWHYRLGLTKMGCVPALPARKLSHDRIPFLDILPLLRPCNRLAHENDLERSSNVVVIFPCIRDASYTGRFF